MKRSWLALGAVALIQCGALAWMVWDRVSLLRGGREVTVEVIPVDPRDLFRGDYVVLGYAFNRAGEVDVPDGVRQGDYVYVTLKPTAPTTWEVAAVDAAYPSSVPPENAVLKGRVQYVFRRDGAARSTAQVRYGIESYFVPEGTGRALEEMVRDKRIEAVLAVGTDGEAAIKALVVDGKRVVTEPLL